MNYWVKIEKINNINAILKTNYPSLIEMLYNYLSAYANNYKFMPKYKMKIWDGKIYFFNKMGVFPIGLLKYVYKFLESEPNLSIEIDPLLLKTEDSFEDFEDITELWLNKEIIPRPYQIDGALKGLIYKRCTLEHATASGKSLTIAMIIMYHYIKKLHQKFVVLVPNVSLVHQMFNDFISYGVPTDIIGKFYEEQRDTDKCITISTWQSLQDFPDFAKNFDFFICDEVHQIKGNTVKTVANSIINADYRIGLTGSMPDNKADCWSIEGAIGTVVDIVKLKQLQEGKYISDIVINIIYLLHKQDILDKLKLVTDFKLEQDFLEQYQPRNKVIKFITEKHIQKNHNVLVLAEHKDHIKELYNLISQIKDAQVFVVTGDMDSIEREKTRQYVNNNKNCVIIATLGVFSTGISINRLHTVIFTVIGKSKIRILQSIGRGLRLHKEKKHLFLYDIADDTHFSKTHLKERIKLYINAEFDIKTTEINLDK
jgi:superfamily II DNA or RNA helicase